MHKIEELTVKAALEKIAKERNDEWGLEVYCRLQSMNDLPAEEACYHDACRSTFSNTEVSSNNVVS